MGRELENFLKKLYLKKYTKIYFNDKQHRNNLSSDIDYNCIIKIVFLEIFFKLFKN